jgi:hypothetical protein
MVPAGLHNAVQNIIRTSGNQMAVSDEDWTGDLRVDGRGIGRGRDGRGLTIPVDVKGAKYHVHG